MDFNNIILLFNAFLFFIIAYIDARKLKIHNISIIILIFFGIFSNLILGRAGIDFFYYFLISALLIFFGFFFFIIGIWGAGDAKLVTVSVLFVELNNVALMIMASFIFSALFGLFYIFCKNGFSLKGILSFYRASKIPFAPGVFLAMVTTNFMY